MARTQSRLRTTLVVAEVALSTVLLAGAALMMQSLWGLLAVDSGFDADNLLTARIVLSGERYEEASGRIEFHRRLQEELDGLPGVTHVGAVNMVPFSNSYSCDTFGLEDRPAPSEGEEPCAETRVVTPGYFEAMGIAVVRGRAFTATDNEARDPVILINQAMADTYWPDGDALGKRFKYGSSYAENEPWRTIVGVVGDVRHFGFREQMRPEVYFPYPDWAYSSMYLTLKVDGEARAAVEPVRAAVQRIDDSLPVFSIATMRDRMAASVVAERLATDLLAAFAAVALTLATVGLYGVLAYNISLRTQEIGLRMALGARSSDLVRRVVGHGAWLSALGIGIGLAGALLATRLLTSFLYEVAPGDPLTLAAVAALLLISAIAASWLPARKAARVDPLVALRAET